MQHFVKLFAAEYGREVTGFDKAVVAQLQGHSWPGNVRELRNFVERHVILSEHPIITEVDLPSCETTGSAIDADLPTLQELERRYISTILEHFEGNRTKAAETLGIDKSTLWRKLQSYAD